MLDPSSAEVSWDYQIGTFHGEFKGLKVGKFGGDITTVAALEAALGVSLSAETGAALQEAYLAAPYVTEKKRVSKLDFMDLFRPDDLVKIYTAAKSVVEVQIELERFNNSPDGDFDLQSERTIAGLQKMEAAGLITVGDADRISGGISWQQ